MTDEPRPEGQSTEAAQVTETAVAAPVEAPPEEAPADQEPAKAKLHQTVEITDTGACRKRIKITVAREDIDTRIGEHFSKLVLESNVTGFRPGKAPRKLIEKRFHKEVGDQVKNEVLMASLEQLGEEHEVAPLSPPNIDPDKIEIPAEGPLVYEFEVEVRPDFELPDYRGMKIKRPVKTFTDEDVAEARRQLLGPRGQIVPKEDGIAQVGDIIVADLTVRAGDRVIGNVQEAQFKVEKQLAFNDGLCRNFGPQIAGAKAGDTRIVDIELSSSAANMPGTVVQGNFSIKDVKTIRLPELTEEFLSENYGLSSPDRLDEAIKVHLERNMEHQQRRSARQQVIAQISAASKWELPNDLVMRHARKALQRRIMEMKADGMSEAEIAKNRRLLEQNIVESTEAALKEHFVLQKIAEVEKIDIDEEDVNDEIERIAAQNNDSPRRVRARMEKEDSLDSLATEMIERKALDLILDNAVYEDVELDKAEEPASLATVDTQAVPGQMHDPAAEAEAQAAQHKEEG